MVVVRKAGEVFENTAFMRVFDMGLHRQPPLGPHQFKYRKHHAQQFHIILFGIGRGFTQTFKIRHGGFNDVRRIGHQKRGHGTTENDGKLPRQRAENNHHNFDKMFDMEMHRDQHPAESKHQNQCQSRKFHRIPIMPAMAVNRKLFIECNAESFEILP